MAVTLIEAAKRHQGDVFRQAIIEIYARSSNLLRVLPFEGIEGNALKYNQESALPGIGFRGVNEGYTESTGVLNPVTEPLVIAGGDLDVDKFIIKTMGENQRSSQEQMKIKALAHKWTNVFIKGDSEVNKKEFDGLQKRLTGDQVISNGATSGGDPLSLANFDEAIDACDDPTAILINKTLKRRLTAAARDTIIGGFITWDKDEFGRRIGFYNDLPLIVMGENADIFKTLSFTEAATGGGTTASSIYVVSLGGDMLTGIQNGDADVTDLGELESKPSMRSRIEWYNGIAMFHPRAAVRLRDISNAAVVV